MKEYMKSYIREIDTYISSNKHNDIEHVIRLHLRKIKFFQHERFIHLVVTLFYALFAILFTALVMVSTIENGVQYMYKQHDKLLKIASRE